MFDYEFQDTARKLDLKRLLKPLLAAEQAMARLDEKLRALPFRDGVIERLIYHEACAVSWLEGHLVPVEDLVQFEAGCLQKISYPELSACHGTYVNLRDVWRPAPEALLAGSTPGERRDRPRLSEDERNGLVCDCHGARPNGCRRGRMCGAKRNPGRRCWPRLSSGMPGRCCSPNNMGFGNRVCSDR